MSGLQIFLLIDMLILGIVGTIAAQHAYTHFLHKRHPEKDHTALKNSPLPANLKDQLIKEARDNFQGTLKAGADSLQHDLKATSDRINLHLEELGNDIIHKEVERYRQQLDELYGSTDKDMKDATAAVGVFVDEHKKKLDELGNQVEAALGAASQDVDSYKQALKTKLDELYSRTETQLTDINADVAEHAETIKQQLSKEVEAEKQQQLQQFDTKLGDAVTAFLLETLQHNVDLGAQTDYLTAMLEEHKSELLQGVSDEAKTAS